MCIEMEGGDFDFGWHPFLVFLLERKEGKDHLQRSLHSSGEEGWVKTICSLIISVLQEMKLMRQLRNHLVVVSAVKTGKSPEKV